MIMLMDGRQIKMRNREGGDKRGGAVQNHTSAVQTIDRHPSSTPLIPQPCHHYHDVRIGPRVEGWGG